MLGLLTVGWSIFVSGDFFDVLRAASHGLWDYFHGSLSHLCYTNKGYGQEEFEKQLGEVSLAVKVASEKLEIEWVDTKDPQHLTERVFFSLTHHVLALKEHYMEQLQAPSEGAGELSAPKLAEYFHTEQSQVCKNKESNFLNV